MLIRAYEEALLDIEKRIKDVEIRDKIIGCIRYLCHPDPALRGHEINIRQVGTNFNLERFVATFDHIATTLRYKAIRTKYEHNIQYRKETHNSKMA